jgi:uncharacterized protein
MDRFVRDFPGAATPDAPDDELALIAQRGIAHEKAYLESLRASGREVWEPPAGADPFEATLAAMRAGVPTIHRAALRSADGAFQGYADFLERVEEPSALGPWSYEVSDTKLARHAKPYFLIQLCAYAAMLEHVQGRRPRHVHIVAGDRVRHSFRTDDYFFYFRTLERAFLEAMRAFDPEKRPFPEARADHRRWQSHAEKILDALDHPSRVAGITSHQVRRLAESGICTMTELAESNVPRVPHIEPAVLTRLRTQARLQIASKGRERPLYELARDVAPGLGLALLPPASPMDVYFDMEGFPHVEGGLEYLFGASVVEDGAWSFVDFWGHDAAGERAAFESLVDWVYARFERDPAMHVYHYAPYEVAALRRLMGKYASREREVDALLRAEVFVDLYRVVRQGVRIGEPRYSLKNVEHLYRPARAGEVATAGQSVVEYARWREQRDGDDWRTSKILAGIRDYNREDCDSTLELAEWLRSEQRKAGIAWAGGDRAETVAKVAAAAQKAANANREDEELTRAMLDEMPAPVPEDPAEAERWRVHELLAHLCTFHRREAKPVWWAMFDRSKREAEEHVEDPDCLGDLVRTETPPQVDKQSLLYEYAFDATQDTKVTAGEDYLVAANLSEVRLHALDLDRGIAVLRRGKKQPAPPERLSLIPGRPFNTEDIVASIGSIASAWRQTRALPSHLDALLFRKPPSIEGCTPGAPLRRLGETASDAAVRVICAMRGTTLAIQGPPGAGKTSTAARAIDALIADGKRVGISSNSHKAIEKLMEEVLAVAKKAGRSIRAAKVNRKDGEAIVAGGRAERVDSMKDLEFEAADAPQLVGGTVWAFSNPAALGMFDYVFVDEAGQVSLANIVGMARATRNFVLMGDQMQLAQPTQGSHPGESGRSALEYLLQGKATIPDDMGLFLDRTWRLHPNLCRFISGAVYEDRLEHEATAAERWVMGGRKEAGLLFVDVAHEGNTQASEEEVDAIERLVSELRTCKLRLEGGKTRDVEAGDIKIVAPYNMQVRRLRERLPGYEIGSVDKFQGQEAPIVIVSMCASTGEVGRGIEFLFSPNRLNVAVSRAQCLAIVVGAGRLARTRVSSVRQMKLVNMFCRIVEDGQTWSTCARNTSARPSMRSELRSRSTMDW